MRSDIRFIILITSLFIIGCVIGINSAAGNPAKKPVLKYHGAVTFCRPDPNGKAECVLVENVYDEPTKCQGMMRGLEAYLKKRGAIRDGYYRMQGMCVPSYHPPKQSS